MVACDMCGKEKKLVNAVVEGTMLMVCGECAKFGNVVEITKPRIERNVIKVKKEDQIDVIDDNYAEKIRNAREKRGLKQDELAKAIAVKESLIHKFETGQMSPSVSIARKFEQFLRIKLISEHKEERIKKEINLKDEHLTIGDLLKLKDE